MDFKIGIITDWLSKDLRKGILIAKELGATGVQFYANKELGPENLGKYERKELNKFLDDNNMEISAICGDVGGHGFVERDENVERIEISKRIIDLAKDLKTDIVTTHIGVIPEDEKNERWQILASAIREIGEYAKSVDAYFAIETGPERAIILKNFLDEVGTKGVKVNLDPANLIMVTGDDPVLAVDILKDYIVHTHAKDGKMLYRKEPEVVYGLKEDKEPNKQAFLETPLGQGDVDFNRYLKALEDIGYNGYLTIEREVGDTPKKDIKLAVDFLKDIIGG